jgi:hypothetical protein
VAIVNSRYASPFHVPGKPLHRLVRAVHKAERDVVYDPSTPGLTSRSVLGHKSTGYLRATPAAQAVTLPLTIDQLEERRPRDHFVDACLVGQPGAALLTPPYLDFGKVDSTTFEINLKMIERAVVTAGPQRTIGFVQMTASKLRDGVLHDTAPLIAETGLERAIIRVRDIGEEARGEDLDALLDALDAFLAAGVEVVFDCAGRLGPLLVHEGAAGFSAGPMRFRKVARELLQVGGGGGGGRLCFEEYANWEWVDRDEIGKTAAACPVPGCPVTAGAELDAIREHNLHVLRHLAEALSTWTTADLVKSLRESRSEEAAEWANVIARRQASEAGESPGGPPSGS